MPDPLLDSFTAADYRAMPDDGHRYQLVDGELIMAPAPNFYHQRIVLNVARILDLHVRRHSLGDVAVSPCDVYLDDLNVFQPDVLFVAAANRSRIHADGVHGAPDLAVEILSPTTAGLDRRKRGLLAKAGTVEFWQIDPALRQLQRFVFAENVAKPVALIDEPETFTSPLFPGLTLESAEFFRS